MKYIQNINVVEAVTFNELVYYGTQMCAKLIGGMPWSFEYLGCIITHENDGCYIVAVPNSGVLMFTPKHMLVKNEQGTMYLEDLQQFRNTYHPALQQEVPTTQGNDILLYEKCPKCGSHLTLMDSVNTETHKTMLVKRCLSCLSYPVMEVRELDDQNVVKINKDVLKKYRRKFQRRANICEERATSYDKDKTTLSVHGHWTLGYNRAIVGQVEDIVTIIDMLLEEGGTVHE